MSHPQHVPDDLVAAFRAHLSGDAEEAPSRTGRRAYQAFVGAMFTEAVRRRLGRHPGEARIIGFVADLRTLSDELADALDPDATERLIAAVDADAGNIDGERALRTRSIVLVAIIRGEHLDPAELDVFLERSRTLANGILG